MEDRQIEESVRELIEDLKNKVDTLTNTEDPKDEELARKVGIIRNKAIKAFNDASAKLAEMADHITNEEEAGKVIENVRNRSKEFYENALGKINELLPEKKEEEIREESVAEEKSDPVSDAGKSIDEIISNVGEEINNFMNREDVRRVVDKTKEGIVDVAEKALEILKGWLAPESEDK